MAWRSTVTLNRAYKSPDLNSKLWKSSTFDKVWRGMPATFGAQVVVPSWKSATPQLSIDVTSSNESALNLLRLLAFDLVQPLNPSQLPILQTQCLLKSRVALHPWAMPTSMQSPPEFLDGAVSHFRHLRREKMKLLAAHSLNFDAEEEYYNRWAEKVEARYNKERWCFGTLQDGFVAENILDHPELETQGVAATIVRAKYLRKELPPLKKSMCIGADDDCGRWVLFGGSKQDTVADTDMLEEEVANAVQLAFSSALASGDPDNCVWVHGDVVCNRETGEAVLIVGPKMSGKTSLALHCLAASTVVNLTATDHCWLFPAAGSESHSTTQSARVCGLPLSPVLRLGTLMGTAMENPCLKVMDTTCIEAFGVAAQNSLETTWHHVAKSTRLNIAENFGPGRVTPCPLRVKCVVVLNWETDRIVPDGPCGVRQCTDVEDGVHTILETGGGEADVLKGHTLLQWRKYDEAAGAKRLSQLLGGGGAKVVEIGGQVSFGKATRFVLSELGIPDASVTKEYRKK